METLLKIAVKIKTFDYLQALSDRLECWDVIQSVYDEDLEDDFINFLNEKILQDTAIDIDELDAFICGEGKDWLDQKIEYNELAKKLTTIAHKLAYFLDEQGDIEDEQATNDFFDSISSTTERNYSNLNVRLYYQIDASNDEYNVIIYAQNDNYEKVAESDSVPIH